MRETTRRSKNSKKKKKEILTSSTVPDLAQDNAENASNLTVVEEKRLDGIYSRVSAQIGAARRAISSTVNTEMVQTYWMIGKEIVEEEQGGQRRAKYGDTLIKNLSNRLIYPC